MAEKAEKATAISNLEELEPQLSDEEKQGNIGKVFNYVLTTIKTGWSLTRAAQDLTSLQNIKDYKKEVEDLFDRLMQENSQCNEKIAKELDECSKKCSSWFSSNTFSAKNLEDIFRKNEGSVEKIREGVLSAIDEHHRSECNRVIETMVKGSMVMAGLYALKLYIAWKKISAASNVIKVKTSSHKSKTTSRN